MLKSIMSKKAWPFLIIGVIVVLPSIMSCILTIINGFLMKDYIINSNVDVIEQEKQIYHLLLEVWKYAPKVYYSLIPTYFVLCTEKFKNMLIPFVSAITAVPVLFTLLMYPLFLPHAFAFKYGNYSGALVEYTATVTIYLTVVYTITYLFKMIKGKTKN